MFKWNILHSSVRICLVVVVVWLTVREVKVRQMPPKPFRERAKKMSADRTAEKIRDTAEVLMTKSLRTRPEHMLSTTSTESFFFFYDYTQRQGWYSYNTTIINPSTFYTLTDFLPIIFTSVSCFVSFFVLLIATFDSSLRKKFTFPSAHREEVELGAIVTKQEMQSLGSTLAFSWCVFNTTWVTEIQTCEVMCRKPDYQS